MGLAQNEKVKLSQLCHSEPEELFRNIQDGLDRIVMKCLDKNADRRYKSVKELTSEIASYLSTQQCSETKDTIGAKRQQSGTGGTFRQIHRVLRVLCATLWLLIAVVLGCTGILFMVVKQDLSVDIIGLAFLIIAAFASVRARSLLFVRKGR